MRLWYNSRGPWVVVLGFALGMAVVMGPLVSGGIAGDTPRMQTMGPSVTAMIPHTFSATPIPEEFASGSSGPQLVGVLSELRLTTNTSPQNETSIAVDPNNANTVVGGMNDYSVVGSGFAGNGVVFSSNGGATWTHSAAGVVLATGFNSRGGDPCLEFDTQGRVFYGHIALLGTGSPFQSNNGVFVARSSTGGASWGTPVAVATNVAAGLTLRNFEDKPYITVDQTAGTFQDRVYLTWTRFYVGAHPAGGTGGGDIMVSSSSNGGVTWTTPLRLPVPLNTGTGSIGASFVQGSEPEVAANGDVFVTFWFGGRIELWRSTNGGTSFTQQTQPFGAAFNTTASVPTPLPGNSFRVNPYPNVETDPTRPNHVYVVAADDPTNLGTDTDIIFARSANNGASWSTVVPLNDDTVDCAQIFPWMAVSSKGAIHVIWYDTRLDAPTCHLMDVFGAYSINGGLSFDPNFRVTSASFDANSSPIQFTGNSFFGDYNGIASGGVNDFHVLWTDTRTGGATREQEIYYASLDCDLTALNCPANTVIPAFSTVPLFSLVGFQITNTATATRAYDYLVTTTGPGTLDPSNPPSISGTTPPLAPGSSFTPPNAGILFGSITSPSVQTVTYTVNPNTDPTWTEQCQTTITIQAPVPVVFQAFSVMPDAGSIRLLWDVRDEFDVLGYNVYRLVGGGTFQALNTNGLLPSSSREFVDTQVAPGREYTYRIGAVEPDGEVVSMSQKGSVQALAMRLDQNAPNPFNPTTSISFVLPTAQHVRLTIFDVEGRLVKTLLNGRASGGVNNVSWDATNNRGFKVGSGVYYYMLTAGSHRETRKMVLLK